MRSQNVILLIVAIVFAFSYVVFGDTVREVPMTLEIANQPPIVSNVSLEDNDTIPLNELDLVAGNFSEIYCTADVRDLDGHTDLDTANGTIWHTARSSLLSSDDNRWHYTNSSCDIQQSTRTNVTSMVNCTFNVWFYANFSEWNCSIVVNDSAGYSRNGTDNSTMNKLIAVNSPNSTLEWGLRAVNTEYPADLNVTVENEGNVDLDLFMDAYNTTTAGVNSEHSFNCSTGYIAADRLVYNDTSGGTYAESLSFVNTSQIDIQDFDLVPQTTGFSATNKSAYLGIYIPQFPTINGTCTGFLRLEGQESN